MPDIVQQLRRTIRSLGRTPAFTLPAVASLALGIALNTTIFSVFSATLLRPLGAPGGNGLVRIGRSERGEREFRSVSYEALIDLRANASSFAELVGHNLEPVVLRGTASTRTVSAEIVAGDYFAVLGALPVLGRAFNAEAEGGFEANPVVVLSDAFWRRTFDADRAVIGRTMILNDHSFTIVGVAPPGFHGSFPGVAIDMWLPAALVDVARRGTPAGTHERSLSVLGRLRDDVSAERAAAELETLTRRLAEAHEDWDADHTLVLGPARGVHPLFGRVLRTFLSLMLGAVLVVLLIACANVASLLLARASARRGEIAVRLALGASRSHLIRQLLLESAVLAMIAGALGVLLAFWPIQLLNTFSVTTGPTGAGIFFDVRIDGQVLLFTAAVTMLIAIAFGLAPAVQATRFSVTAALRETHALAGRLRSGLRGALIVGQVGISFALLVVAALLFRSLQHATKVDVGVDPDQVVVLSFDLQTLGYEHARSDAFYVELLDRVRRLPGVENAALADFVPMGPRSGHPVPFTVSGAESEAGGGARVVPVGRVSDAYFETVRQALLRGRGFTARDGGEAPRVVIVNEAMARRYWPGVDPIGKRIGLGEDPVEYRVVGVARDASHDSFGGDVGPFLFLPTSGERRLDLHIRTRSTPSRALSDLRRLVHEIDPGIPQRDGSTMREAMAFSLLPTRIAQIVFVTAGLIAVLLATGGLYGLVSYTLALRLEEIGIRVALGASRRSVFRVVIGPAIRLTIIGVAIGTAIATAATRLMAALFHGLSPSDPLSFGAMAALMLLVTIIAGYTAGRRGLGVDPMTILRRE